MQQQKRKKLEGILAKEIHSPYLSKRSHSWLKIKTQERQEAVICGFTAPKGSREKFGALVLGVFGKGHWRYIGHVGTGFDQKTLNDIVEKLQPLITKKNPFISPPPSKTQITWVKPKILCEVSFAEWTKDNLMRHPVFLGLRDDKNPKEIKKEVPSSTKIQTVKKPTGLSKKDLAFTHLDKIYWPKEGYTKGDLLNYYNDIAPYILPYLKDRPQTLHRFPNGIEEEGFYQKNVDSHFPDWLSTTLVKHKNEKHTYLLIPDKKSLLFAANLGSIDFNPFNSRIQKLDYPDYLVLDLDPEGITFAKVIETAQAIHEFLTAIDMQSYCKTSGATGLHIYIPLGAKYTYMQVKLFAQLLAEMINQKIPQFTSIQRKISQRKHAVYIDYLQNNFGQTVAAPYCVRPRAGAPVSTPLEWKEVKSGLDPLDYDMKNILRRLKKKGDIFLPVLHKGIDIKKCLTKLQKFH